MKQVLYTKYNSQRKPDYQIKTTIVSELGKQYVIKSPMTDAAQHHLIQMRKNFALAAKLYPQMQILVGEQIEYGRYQSLQFPFLYGVSSETMVDFSVQSPDMIVEDARNLIDRLTETPNVLLCNFILTDEFRNVFPGCEPEEGIPAMAIANLDAIPSNFMMANGQMWCMDYEWMVEFPVPTEFIRYRIALYLYAEHAAYLSSKLSREEFFEKLGISSERCSLYQSMEDGFQEYVHGKDRKYLYLQRYEKNVFPIGKDDVSVLEQKELEIEQLRRDIVSRTEDIDRLNQYIYDLKDAIKHPVSGWKKWKQSH